MDAIGCLPAQAQNYSGETEGRGILSFLVPRASPGFPILHQHITAVQSSFFSIKNPLKLQMG